MQEIAKAAGLAGSRPGAAGSGQRQRFALRLLVHLTRQVAAASGTVRLAVRARPGADLDHLVLAFPWRRRGRAEALAHGVVDVVDGLTQEPVDVLVARAARAVLEAEPGAAPDLPQPRIPVVSVTGTNGKTTTTRILAHLCMTAGRSTGWTSTDGVYVDGRLIEPGDWSGPGGARLVLEEPIEVAVLETARGGLLLRGMGVAANDVSVVTNVSADHLGLQGIDTVDQLAEVKAVVTKVTRAQGWAVLNGEDPRVFAMRSGIRARPWVFALSPDSPAIRQALNEGGRAATVLDGDLVLLGDLTADPDHLLPVVDVPVTLAGLSPHNVANVLAATAAAFALDLPRAAILEGLRTFVPDVAHNPGRMNVFDLDGVVVVLDFAHNPEGLQALLDVARGLRLARARRTAGAVRSGRPTRRGLGAAWGARRTAGRRGGRRPVRALPAGPHHRRGPGPTSTRVRARSAPMPSSTDPARSRPSSCSWSARCRATSWRSCATRSARSPWPGWTSTVPSP